MLTHSNKIYRGPLYHTLDNSFGIKIFLMRALINTLFKICFKFTDENCLKGREERSFSCHNEQLMNEQKLVSLNQQVFSNVWTCSAKK